MLSSVNNGIVIVPAKANQPMLFNPEAVMGVVSPDGSFLKKKHKHKMNEITLKQDGVIFLTAGGFLPAKLTLVDNKSWVVNEKYILAVDSSVSFSALRGSGIFKQKKKLKIVDGVGDVWLAGGIHGVLKSNIASGMTITVRLSALLCYTGNLNVVFSRVTKDEVEIKLSYDKTSSTEEVAEVWLIAD